MRPEYYIRKERSLQCLKVKERQNLPKRGNLIGKNVVFYVAMHKGK